MKPPYREDSHRFAGNSGAEGSSPEGDGTPVVERVDGNGVAYVELTDRGSWEDKQRARSYPQSLEILFGALSILTMWVSTIAVIASLIMKFTGHPDPWTRLSVISLIVLVISLITALSLSLTKLCPLCQGPPLHSRRCLKHRLADRWPPLTHRATVVLRILTTLSFRCMYCGTPFRLFKKSSRQR